MDFDSYIRESSPRLMRVAWLLAGSVPAAEDLLQTAYAKVLPRWGKIGAYDDPDAYVRRVLLNTRASGWRRSQRESVVAVLPEITAQDAFGVVEDVDRLVRALAKLGPRQRKVIVLRYYADLSEAEVADALGISTGTVKSQASRGLTNLRSVLIADEEPSSTERPVL